MRSGQTAPLKRQKKLTRVVERGVQVFLDCGLMDAERTANAHCRQLASVNQAVDGHLGYAHDVSNFRNGQKGAFICILH